MTYDQSCSSPLTWQLRTGSGAWC